MNTSRRVPKATKERSENPFRDKLNKIALLKQQQADLKKQMDSLEEEDKKLQKEILPEARQTGETKFETKYGPLTLVEKENFDFSKKEEIYDEIGWEPFVRAASLSKTGLKDEIGESGIMALINDGFIVKNKSTFYFKRSGGKKS